MTTGLTNESFLLAQFNDFYTEVIRLKRLIKESGGMKATVPEVPVGESGNGNGNGNGHGPDGSTTLQVPLINPIALQTLSGSENITALAVRGSVDAAEEPTTEQSKLAVLVWQNLLALFRRNAVQILRAAGKPTDNYFEAQYVMAAFADDVFIHLDWEGKRAWTSNLIETALFQSHVAGELFFEKLDRLLRERDPATKSLAAVYLSALSLGFRGKYHGLNDHGKLRRYRMDLFDFVFRHPPDLLDKTKVAFPQSYVQNLRKEKRRKLTNPRVWLVVLGVVFLTYLVGSHVVWLRLTSRIEGVNTEIVDIKQRLDQTKAPAN